MPSVATIEIDADTGKSTLIQVKHWTITDSDRCDRCGARAYARVLVALCSDLYFCGHHFAQYEATFRRRGFTIRDEREQLIDEEAAR